MPFLLDDVFTPAQKQFLPKGLDFLEDVALASHSDIPIKTGYEYIVATRRYLAKKLIQKIWRESDQLLIRVRPNLEYPEDLARAKPKRIKRICCQRKT